MIVKVSRKWWSSIGATMVLLALIWAVGGALAQEPGPEGDFSLASTVAAKINYQGRLTDPDGVPLDGPHEMRFQIYDDAGAGTMLWDSGLIGVDVDNGLFNVPLAVDPYDFNGQALWLRIQVGGEWLSPRQELVPVPYALSLRPGAVIAGASAGTGFGQAVVNVDNYSPPCGGGTGVYAQTCSGSAVRGVSGDVGVYGYSGFTSAVRGEAVNGRGGYFTSEEGYGIEVTSNGTNHWDHAGYFTANWGYGIYAKSAENMAIRGEAGDVSGLWQPAGPVGVAGIGEARGVYGSSGDGQGVRGVSINSSGVSGETESDDQNSTAGVWGYDGSGAGVAVRGLKYGSSGMAVWGTNWGDTGSGVVGSSTNYVGVWGETDQAYHNYGFYTPDNIYSLNIHIAGALMHVMQNAGSEPLDPGDVVVFEGIRTPLEAGESPVIQVVKATTSDSTAVAGVVYSGFNVSAVTGDWSAEGVDSADGAQVTTTGPVAPGEYLLLVVQGPAQVKASALSGTIRTGDLLSTGGSDGCAAAAAQVTIEGVRTAMPGTVLGKALEPLNAGQGLIYAFVTLQ
jgi:hypothetical protein